MAREVVAMAIETLFDSRDVSEMARQCRHLDVAPVLLRLPYGLPSGNPIDQILSRIVPVAMQRVSEMREPELEVLLAEMPPFHRWLAETLREERWIEEIVYGCLIGLLRAEDSPFRDVINGSFEDGEVCTQYPELIDILDRDGLVELDDRFGPMDVGVLYKQHVLQYHQFLRRSYAAHHNVDFLNRFVAFYSKSRGSNRFAVALDARRLMPEEYYRNYAEKDMWYGPRFERDRVGDPALSGTTLVKRASPYPLFDKNHDRTEFRWSTAGSVKTFEAEELSSPTYVHDGYIINRYVHAEFDLESGSFRHFDGAAKVYSSDAYAARFDTELPNEPRCQRKIKLFRVDGEIETDSWIDLTTFFFRGNEMVVEYFDPELYEQLWGDAIRRYQQKAFGAITTDEESSSDA